MRSLRSSSAPEAYAKVGEPRRIVLKMSGEALASAASDETIDAATVERMAKEMARAVESGGLELAVVVGGGKGGEVEFAAHLGSGPLHGFDIERHIQRIDIA